MFAFGLPTGGVVGMTVMENAFIGVLGTAIGLAGGYIGLAYIVAGFEQVTPHLLVQPTLSTAIMLTTLVLASSWSPPLPCSASGARFAWTSHRPYASSNDFAVQGTRRPPRCWRGDGPRAATPTDL